MTDPPLPASAGQAELGTLAVALLGPSFGRDFVEAMAPNTLRSYTSDLRDYFGWVSAHNADWADPHTVAAYLEAVAGSGAAYATVARRLTAIHKLTLAAALASDRPLTRADDPTKHPAVTVKLQALRRRLGTDPDSAAPLTASRLLETLIPIDTTTLAGVRDRALLLVGFYGALRRSELAGIRRGHLLDDGDDGIAIELPTSKGSQTEAVWVPIAAHRQSHHDPITAVTAWLTIVDRAQPQRRGEADPHAAVWLPVTKGDTITRPTQPLTAAAINSIVQRRVKAAALPDASAYSAHSLRSGFVTEAKNRGIDEADIMAHTRHKSIRMMRHYDKRSGWWQRNPTTTMAL